MAPCLVLDRLSRSFGALKAVDAVTLTLQAGERHAVIGPNGAGKTTLFNLISGELAPTEGTVQFGGADVTGWGPHRRARRGLARTFQITKLFPNLTVLENALLACEAAGTERFTWYRPLWSCADLARRAEALLESFALQPVRSELARNLAYGDQRKLDVALALAGRPRVLLLDEPMAGLSAAERESMQRVLDALDASTAVLLIEHDMDIAFRFAQSVTVLHHGKVLTSGPKDDVSADRRVQEIYLGNPC